MFLFGGTAIDFLVNRRDLLWNLRQYFCWCHKYLMAFPMAVKLPHFYEPVGILAGNISLTWSKLSPYKCVAYAHMIDSHGQWPRRVIYQRLPTMSVHSPYKKPEGHLNIKMSSYQYRDSQVKDKTVLRPSYCPACRTTFIATRFRVAVICPIIPVPHCIRVFFYFVWFVFINHIFQFYYELCTYCNILDIYLS